MKMFHERRGKKKAMETEMEESRGSRGKDGRVYFARRRQQTRVSHCTAPYRNDTAGVWIRRSQPEPDETMPRPGQSRGVLRESSGPRKGHPFAEAALVRAYRVLYRLTRSSLCGGPRNIRRSLCPPAHGDAMMFLSRRCTVCQSFTIWTATLTTESGSLLG